MKVVPGSGTHCTVSDLYHKKTYTWFQNIYTVDLYTAVQYSLQYCMHCTAVPRFKLKVCHFGMAVANVLYVQYCVMCTLTT